MEDAQQQKPWVRNAFSIDADRVVQRPVSPRQGFFFSFRSLPRARARGCPVARFHREGLGTFALFIQIPG